MKRDDSNPLQNSRVDSFCKMINKNKRPMGLALAQLTEADRGRNPSLK
jgi:hypothetical protein